MKIQAFKGNVFTMKVLLAVLKKWIESIRLPIMNVSRFILAFGRDAVLARLEAWGHPVADCVTVDGV